MSYCRFSSLNWTCDVYVYEDVSGGWTTHVAGNRLIIPPIPDLGWDLTMRLRDWCGAHWDAETRQVVYPRPRRALVYKAWLRVTTLWHNQVHMRSLGLIPRRPIGLPYDADTFSHDTPGECADFLEMLRDIGYNVPEYTIEALRAEEAEGA